MGIGTSHLLEGGHLRRSAFPFALWSVVDVQELLTSLKQVGTFVMVEAQFCSWICSKIPSIQEDSIHSLFSVLDSCGNGRVNCLEFLAGVMMLSSEEFSTKTQFCFELYDFNLNGSLSTYELILMLRSSVLGTLKLLELDPAVEQYSEKLDELKRDTLFEQIAQQAIRVYDRDANKSLSYLEFVSWARGNREVMTFVERFHTFARAAASEAMTQRQLEGESSFTASSSMSQLPESPRTEEIETSLMEQQDLMFASNNSGDMDLPTEVLDARELVSQPDGKKLTKKEIVARAAAAYAMMHTDAHAENQKAVFDGQLEVEWVYGFAAKKTQNTVRYVDSSRERIVYPAGNAVVVHNVREKTQLVYSGHSSSVVAIQVHPQGKLIASADSSGEIHLWYWDKQRHLREGTRPQTSVILKTFPGSIQLSFSSDGVLLAVACNKRETGEPTRTRTDATKNTILDLWDWFSQQRVVDAVYITSDKLHSICWASEEYLLAACGVNFVKFFTLQDADAYKPRSFYDKSAVARKGLALVEQDAIFSPSQTYSAQQFFTSACFLGKNLVCGTGNGELFLFDRSSLQLEQVVRAHPEKQPVRCLAEWSRGLVSGASDGELRLWDMGLHPLAAVRQPKLNNNGGNKYEQGRKLSNNNAILLVSPNDPLLFADIRIASLDVLNNTKSKIALVGLSSGYIIEINLDERTGSSYRTKIGLVQGHVGGCVSSIAIHPTDPTLVATCSEYDYSARLWNVETHQQVAACLLEAPPVCVAFSPSGDTLAVGLSNGKVTLRNPASTDTLSLEISSILSPEYDEEDRAFAKRRVSAVEFSPDGSLLAVSCISGSTYLFVARRIGPNTEKLFTCMKALKAPEVNNIFGSTVGRSRLDWSKDSKILKVTLENLAPHEYARTFYRSYFWSISKGGILIDTVTFPIKDVVWASQNFPEDSTIAGIPRAVHDKVTCFDASDELLVAGSVDGSIRVTKFPCKATIAQSQVKSFYLERGHRAFTSLKFLHGGTRVLSATTSKQDGHFVQWRVIRDEKASSRTLAESEESKEQSPVLEDYDSEVEEEVLYLSEAAFGSTPDPRHPLVGSTAARDPFEIPWGMDGPGDFSMPHWQNQFSAPSKDCLALRRREYAVMGFPEPKRDVDLKLDSILGFGNGNNRARPCAKYLVEHQVAFPAAGVVVLLRLDETSMNQSKQRYFQRHVSAVDTMTVTPQRTNVATACADKVFIWDAVTLNIVATIILPWKDGVAKLSFSPDEDLLCIIGKDLNQTIAIYDWRKERLKGMSPGGGKAILDMVWTTPRTFCCVGTRHITFWTCNPGGEGPPESRKGFFWSQLEPLSIPLQTILSVCLIDKDEGILATGMADGSIVLWSCQQRAAIGVIPPSSTRGPCFSLCLSPQGHGSFFAGFKNGQILLFALTEAARQAVSENGFIASCSPTSGINGFFEVSFEVASLDSSVRTLDAVVERLPHHDSYNAYLTPIPSRATPQGNFTYVLAATRKSSLIEIQVDHVNLKASTSNPLCLGHERGQVWGLAAHPFEPIAVTGGSDSTIRVWNVATRAQIGSVQVPERVKSIALRVATETSEASEANGKEIAVGLSSGKIRIFDMVQNNPTNTVTNTDVYGTALVILQARIELTDPKDWVQALQFSPKGTYLAAGSHDTKIYVYDTSSYSLLHTLAGHSAFVRSLDWAFSDKDTGREHLQSASGCGELLYWNITSGVEIKSSKAVRDFEWATWTSLIGWPVKAVEDIVGVSACGKAFGSMNLVVGKKDGSIVMYPYPCETENKKMFKRTRVHAGVVTQVCFAAHDRFLLSASDDGTICIWTSENVEEVSRAKLDWIARTPEEQLNMLAVYESKKASSRDLSQSTAEEIENARRQANYQTSIVADATNKVQIDVNVPAIPWKVNRDLWKKSLRIHEVNRYASLPREAPSVTLDWVYGHSPGTGVHYVGGQDDILFTAGNVAVVQKPIREGRVAKQSFFARHRAKITCVGVSEDGRTVVTGDEAGAVYLWDVSTVVVRCRANVTGKVTHAAFSQAGKYIGVSNDAGVFFLFNSNGDLLVSSADEAPFPSVRGIVVLPQSEVSEVSEVEIATVGGDTIKLWTFDPTRSRLVSKSAKAPEGATITCLTEFANGLVAGHQNGSVVHWNRDNLTRRRVLTKQDIKADQISGNPGQDAGGISSLTISRTDVVLCLHENGVVVALDRRFEPVRQISFQAHPFTESICPDRLSGGDRLLVSLRQGGILEMSSVSKQARNVQCGHWTEVVSEAEKSGRTKFKFAGRLVCCLFERNLRHYAVSAGINNLVHLWDLDEHKLLQTRQLPDRATACSVSAANGHIAVGTKGGSLVVFSENLLREILTISVSYQQSGDHSRDAIRSLAYSPDGQHLAVGGDDAQIRVLGTRNYALEGLVPKRHQGPVSHLDWSSDSRLIRSNVMLDAVPVGDLMEIIPRPSALETLVSYAPNPKLENKKENVQAELASGFVQWGSLSCPLAEHCAELWEEKGMLVSSCAAGLNRRAVAIATDGTLLGGGGESLTTIKHVGAGTVQGTGSGKLFLSSGLYDGLMLQFKQTN